MDSEIKRGTYSMTIIVWREPVANEYIQTLFNFNQIQDIEFSFFHMDISEWKVIYTKCYIHHDGKHFSTIKEEGNEGKGEREYQEDERFDFVKNNLVNKCVILYFQETFDPNKSINFIKNLIFAKKINNLLPYVMLISKDELMKEKSNKFNDLMNHVPYDNRDIRLISLQKFTKDIKTIYKELLRCCFYYNQIEPRIFPCSILRNSYCKTIFKKERKTKQAYINIMVIGRSGSGKSFFINQIIGNKICKEGDGFPITDNIRKYHHPTIPISFYDTPDCQEDIYRHFLDRDDIMCNDMNKQGDSVHFLLVLVNVYSNKTISSHKSIIDLFIKRGIPVLFVLTKAHSTVQIKDSKEELFVSLNSLFPGKLNDMKLIFGLEYYHKIKKNDLSPFKPILRSIGEILQKHKIDEKDIINSEQNGYYPIQKVLEKSLFFPYYYHKRINDKSILSRLIELIYQSDQTNLHEYKRYYPMYNRSVDTLIEFANNIPDISSN